VLTGRVVRRVYETRNRGGVDSKRKNIVLYELFVCVCVCVCVSARASAG